MALYKSDHYYYKLFFILLLVVKILEVKNIQLVANTGICMKLLWICRNFKVS